MLPNVIDHVLSFLPHDNDQAKSSQMSDNTERKQIWDCCDEEAVMVTKRWRDSSPVRTEGHCPDDGGCPNSSLEATQTNWRTRRWPQANQGIPHSVLYNAQVLRWASSTQTRVRTKLGPGPGQPIGAVFSHRDQHWSKKMVPNQSSWINNGQREYGDRAVSKY